MMTNGGGWPRAGAAIGLLLALLGWGAEPAWAAGETITGTLRNGAAVVPGVRIDARAEDGGLVGSATSDAAGRWTIVRRRRA
jgi:hypothetical protein